MKINAETQRTQSGGEELYFIFSATLCVLCASALEIG